MVLHFVAYQLEGILCVSVYTYMSVCIYIYVDDMISTHILFFLFQVFIALLLILTQLCLLTFARLLYDMVFCRRNASIISDFLNYWYLLTFYLSVRPLGDLTHFSRNTRTAWVVTSYTENLPVFPLTRMGKVTALLLSPFSTVDWKWILILGDFSLSI